MRNLRGFLYWLLIFSFPLFLLTTNIRVLVNEIKLYEYAINKYDIVSVTGIESSELKRAYQHWIDYYNLRQNTPQINVTTINGDKVDLLSEKEVIHMQDVAQLVRLDMWVQMIALLLAILGMALLLVMFRSWKPIIKAIVWGSVSMAVIVLLLGLLAVTNFDQLSLLFHRISFANEFWMLDPSTDYLIMMIPGGFLYDAAILGFGIVLLQSAIIAGICFGILAYFRGKESLVN